MKKTSLSDKIYKPICLRCGLTLENKPHVSKDDVKEAVKKLKEKTSELVNSENISRIINEIFGDKLI